MRAAAAAAKSLQSCPTLCDCIDGSPPGVPVPGILQARTLEWVAISVSRLKTKYLKTKIMASGPITAWQTEEEKVEVVIDAFKLWYWRRLLKVPWTARRSNQSVVMEINPEYSSEGLTLKLKLQYFGHLM